MPLLSGPVTALFEREIRTLVRSPKGRLLFAMPFFLLILLKLVGGAPLLEIWLGPTWASQLLTALAVYVLASLAGQFLVNQFGYDGQAVRLVFLLPPSPREWLLGRNLAHGVFGLVQFLALAGLLFALLPRTSGSGLVVPFMLFPTGMLTLMAVGNLLSIRYPRRFVFTLKRRDRPAPASFGWLLGALGLILVGLAGALWLAKVSGLPAVIPLALLLVVALFTYLRLLPLAVAEARRRREALVGGVIEL